ncbi:MAG TPA: hypothetical protein VFE32_21250 [Puia sp.]|jgi:hypothetical protein|nr:hypothetical protein [Puia sp.]
MKEFMKIAGFNLLVLLGYSLAIRFLFMFSAKANDRSTGIALLSAFAVGVHVLEALVTMAGKFGTGDKAVARAWLGAAGVVLVVGFSVCLGNASL